MTLNRIPYAAKVLFLGLGACQIIATIQVYLSNISLYRNLVAIKNAGYLPIPNQLAMQSLQEFGTAFLGGLFFTFTVGACLTIFSLAAALIWDRLFSRNIVLLIGLGLLWMGCILVVNLRSISPIVTSYYLVLPPLVFCAALRWLAGSDSFRRLASGRDLGRSATLIQNPPKSPHSASSRRAALRRGDLSNSLSGKQDQDGSPLWKRGVGGDFKSSGKQIFNHTPSLKHVPKSGTGQRNWLYRLVHVVPVVLLTLFWTSQLDNRTFLDLRDHLLLSNPLGTRINDFYYDYTLYPAEVFKSLDQKLIKTCNLQDIQQRTLLARVERELLNHDYLPVDEEIAADLHIVQEGKLLAFRNKGKTILSITAEDFFSAPRTLLEDFSAKSDRNAFFRQFTFFSLLLGFPGALYIIFYGLIRFVTSFLLDLRTSSVTASILCFLAGTIILIPSLQGRGVNLEMKQLSEALESERWHERVAALRALEGKGMEVSNLYAYQRLLTSPRIAERYWLVRALGESRKPETYRDLVVFLDDPHPNVVSMAFYALGRRGDRRAVGEILSRLQTSTDWYNQWYGYKALRALGWKQTKSK